MERQIKAPTAKQLKKFASSYSKEDWHFLCGMSLFYETLMCDLNLCRTIATQALLAKRLGEEYKDKSPKKKSRR